MLYDPRRQIYNAVLQTLLNSLLNLRGKQQKFYLGKRKQCQLTVWLPLLVNANKGSLDSGESHWPQKRQSASSTRGRRHHRWDKIRWGKKRNIFSALWCKVKKKKTNDSTGGMSKHKYMMLSNHSIRCKWFKNDEWKGFRSKFATEQRYVRQD